MNFEMPRIRNKLYDSLHGNFYWTSKRTAKQKTDVERLREDFHSDYIFTTELKTITDGLATTCGTFMAIASLGITTLKHIRQAPEKKQMKCKN